MTIDEYARRIGQEIGVSAWRRVTQSDIDGFADVTDDHQFIHTDPARAAAETPFGGTIAHGFLTLALLPALARDTLPPIAGRTMGINYGFGRIRFVAPVPSGSNIRGRFSLLDVAERRPGEYMVRYRATIEIAGEPPTTALAADWLTIVRVA